jgi:bis(5'-nucleosyl)-tetraphosphatase (symmetrical)
MAVYAIGDVQGCLDPLLRLLDRIGFSDESDQLWFTGELVNRGPKSVEVLRLVRGLGESACTVLGNHDLHLLALASGRAAQTAAGDSNLGPVLNAADRDELLDWLRQRPLLHHDASLGCTLIHAGLPPQWNVETAASCAREVEDVLRGPRYDGFLADMYGNEPNKWSDKLAGVDRLRFTLNCLTRLRYCHEDGDLELELTGPPGEQAPGIIPWFRVPGRASAGDNIVFGHWSTLGLLQEGGITALDSGCVWGGGLSAVQLDEPGSFVTEPCLA